ncbi:MAG: hypothetical protein AAF989_17700, partial [Planctomycetota bacterium]
MARSVSSSQLQRSSKQCDNHYQMRQTMNSKQFLMVALLATMLVSVTVAPLVVQGWGASPSSSPSQKQTESKQPQAENGLRPGVACTLWIDNGTTASGETLTQLLDGELILADAHWVGIEKEEDDAKIRRTYWYPRERVALIRVVEEK